MNPLVTRDGCAHLMDAEHIDRPAKLGAVTDTIGQIAQCGGKHGVLHLPAHAHPRILKEGVLIGKVGCGKHDTNAKATVVLFDKIFLKVNGLEWLIVSGQGRKLDNEGHGRVMRVGHGVRAWNTRKTCFLLLLSKIFFCI